MRPCITKSSSARNSPLKRSVGPNTELAGLVSGRCGRRLDLGRFDFGRFDFGGFGFGSGFDFRARRRHR
jgi:hypothetical protein